MPCWTKQSNTVDMDKVDRVLLVKALKALGYHINDDAYSLKLGCEFSADHFGWNGSVYIKNGKLFVGASREGVDLTGRINELKRAYSGEVVQAACKRFGWNLTRKTDDRFIATRRS